MERIHLTQGWLIYWYHANLLNIPVPISNLILFSFLYKTKFKEVLVNRSIFVIILLSPFGILGFYRHPSSAKPRTICRNIDRPSPVKGRTTIGLPKTTRTFPNISIYFYLPIKNRCLPGLNLDLKTWYLRPGCTLPSINN